MATAKTAKTQLAVLGGGPGGYAAAFAAADRGLDVTLIDPAPNPGGVCLYRGCIPSKALLHAAHTVREAADAEAYGLSFAKPTVDLDRLRAWKATIIDTLTGDLGKQVTQKKVTHLRGLGRFVDAGTLSVTAGAGETRLSFEHAIVATGSVPVRLPGQPDDPRIMDSTGALDLTDLPGSLLVVGGGYIGLELGSVYAALGTPVTIVEMTGGLLPGVDRDLVSVLQRKLKRDLAEIRLNTKVAAMTPGAKGVDVTLSGKEGDESRHFDRVLVAVGRRPAARDLGLEAVGVELDARGFIPVDAQRRTAAQGIYAIGDVAGEPMLAHKATHEAWTAVEAITGDKAAAFAPKAIPAVVFTDPEIAWCGLTETAAREAGIKVKTAKLPWRASGRALTLNRDEGLTKLLVDPDTDRVLGVGLAGPGAGELIAEGVLAVEMAARVEDLRESIHAHPTLSELLGEAADRLYTPPTA
ncbi:MAG: dihydrolipoyl dehydrogenase [Candidatus Krumholzibacteriia bacterium]